jgi:8-oxo-dGTP pyrophosphatase MutT (NUDIX family)
VIGFGYHSISMSLDEIRRRLASYRPQRVNASDAAARAAVALVLRPAREDLELLVIERAARAGDPWSGHMALPGGRRHAADPDIIHTAARETAEEVGIDVREDGELLGALDELHAIARRRPVDLVISPLVWALQRPLEPTLNRREVAAALWVPLSFLRSAAARGVYRRSLEGDDNTYPAFQYQGYTIWGLTHRILHGFFELIE